MTLRASSDHIVHLLASLILWIGHRVQHLVNVVRVGQVVDGLVRQLVQLLLSWRLAARRSYSLSALVLLEFLLLLSFHLVLQLDSFSLVIGLCPSFLNLLLLDLLLQDLLLQLHQALPLFLDKIVVCESAHELVLWSHDVRFSVEMYVGDRLPQARLERHRLYVLWVLLREGYLSHPERFSCRLLRRLDRLSDRRHSWKSSVNSLTSAKGDPPKASLGTKTT